jgi:hypothetical protein
MLTKDELIASLQREVRVLLALLAQRLLQPLRRLLQLPLQSLHLLGDILQLLLGDQPRLGHLMRLAIRFPDCRPDSHRHPRQPVFPSHHVLPQQTPAILYPKIPAAKPQFSQWDSHFWLSA